MGRLTDKIESTYIRRMDIGFGVRCAVLQVQEWCSGAEMPQVVPGTSEADPEA